MQNEHIIVDSIDGTAIRCTCCGRGKKVGEIHVENESVELVSRHHGTNHVAKVSARNIVESLSGTSSREGVAKWLNRLF